ncbi:MAG: monovalent cation/H(+) antiporter subunit G [Chloroflexia bacterium]
MSLRDVMVWVLLAVGVAAALVACLGMLVMPNFYARLHYVGLASVPAALALAAGVAVSSGMSPATTKAIIAAVVVAIGSPAITHATARAALVREHGHAPSVPPESEDGLVASPPPAERAEVELSQRS